MRRLSRNLLSQTQIIVQKEFDTDNAIEIFIDVERTIGDLKQEIKNEFDMNHLNNIELIDSNGNELNDNDKTIEETDLINSGQIIDVRIPFEYIAKKILDQKRGELSLKHFCKQQIELNDVESNDLLRKCIALNDDSINKMIGLELREFVDFGNIVKIQKLINAGINDNIVNQKCDFGSTALMKAVTAGNDIVNVLLNSENYYIDVNARSANGQTALMQAAMYGYSKVIKTLLESKYDVNVNAQADDGYTALTYAVGGLSSGYSNKATVNALLKSEKYHIDINIPTKYGDTALTIAETNGMLDIANLLNEYN